MVCEIGGGRLFGMVTEDNTEAAGPPLGPTASELSGPREARGQAVVVASSAEAFLAALTFRVAAAFCAAADR